MVQFEIQSQNKTWQNSDERYNTLEREQQTYKECLSWIGASGPSSQRQHFQVRLNNSIMAKLEVMIILFGIEIRLLSCYIV